MTPETTMLRTGTRRGASGTDARSVSMTRADLRLIRYCWSNPCSAMSVMSQETTSDTGAIKLARVTDDWCAV